MQLRRHKTAFRGKFFAYALVGLTLPWSGVALSAGQFGTSEDAKAMLERAIAALKADPSAALKAFNDEKIRNSAIAISLCFALTCLTGISLLTKVH